MAHRGNSHFVESSEAEIIRVLAEVGVEEFATIASAHGSYC